MPRRLAVAVALLVCAVCVLCGLAADNTFAEIVWRALKAMFATLAIGLVVGTMAQKMLDDSVKELERKSGNSETKLEPKDR